MTDSDELCVVGTERQVAALVAGGQRAETRSALEVRLAEALLPDTRFADRADCRLALGFVLAAGGAPQRQLDLFEVSRATAERAGADPIGAVRELGGAAWVRTVAAVDHAVGTVRSLGVTAARLARVGARLGGVDGSRARLLVDAMSALDRALERANARDGRLRGALLADALRRATPDTVVSVVGARRLRSRWVLRWDRNELDWWRMLDEKLLRIGGWAKISLPAFERPLRSGRARAPLDELADAVASGLDGAPESDAIAPVLGDLAGDASAADLKRVELVTCPDRVAQARCAAACIAEALREGACVEGVGVIVPSTDDSAMAPLRRALEDEGLVASGGHGRPGAGARITEIAFAILEAAETFDRRLVARVLASGYVDPTRIVDESPGRASSAIAAFTRKIEATFTAAGADEIDRFVRTAGDGPEGRVARAVADALAAGRTATTRRARLTAARTLWNGFGIGARAGRGGLRAFGSDGAAVGVAGAERAAVVADARAWEGIVAALTRYESWAEAIGVADGAVDATVFRCELRDFVDRTITGAAGERVAAVRVGNAEDVAGEPLERLVVIDANAGVLPRREASDALVSDSLRRALAPDSVAATQSDAVQLAAIATSAACSARVTLIFSAEDDAGAPLAPSPIVDALARSGVRVRVAPALSLPAVSDAARARAAREAKREAFFLDPTRPRSDVVGRLEGSQLVHDALVAATGGGGAALAVTGLERFARCAFMGFAHVVLAARELDEREELPDAREEGVITHEALAAAFAAGGTGWARRPRDRDRLLRDGMSAADRVLASWDAHAGVRRLARRRVVEIVRSTLEAALEDESWDFVAAEQRIGATGTGWPALLIADEDETLTLKGSLDRLDRAHDGRMLRVVDYKRSESTARDASTQLGVTALQVPLYAAAATRQLATPATGVYLVARTRGSGNVARYQARAAERVEELLRTDPANPHASLPIEQLALGLVTSVRRGALEPVPADEGICRTCAYSGGCRKPRFAMLPEEEEDG